MREGRFEETGKEREGSEERRVRLEEKGKWERRE